MRQAKLLQVFQVHIGLQVLDLLDTVRHQASWQPGRSISGNLLDRRSDRSALPPKAGGSQGALPESHQALEKRLVWLQGDRLEISWTLTHSLRKRHKARPTSFLASGSLDPVNSVSFPEPSP